MIVVIKQQKLRKMKFDDSFIVLIIGFPFQHSLYESVRQHYQKFNQNFTVYSLYTFCIQHYRDRWNKLANQYFNFATYVNLQKERKTIIKKQNGLISQWRQIISAKQKFAYKPSHIQELILVRDILTERKHQALVFYKFFKFLVKDTEILIKDRLTFVLDKLITHLDEILLQVFRISKQTFKKQKIEALLEKKKQFYQQVADNKDIQLQKSCNQVPNTAKLISVQRASKQVSNWKLMESEIVEKSDFEEEKKLNEFEQSYLLQNLIVKSNILKRKPRPPLVKLLSDQEVENLKSLIGQRNKSTTISIKQSQRSVQNFKSKVRNFYTLHTQIGEDENQIESNQDSHQQFQNSQARMEDSAKVNNVKKNIRHYQSTFEDRQMLSKLITPQEKYKKQFQSIRKLEDRSNSLYKTNFKESRELSKYTNESSVMKNKSMQQFQNLEFAKSDKSSISKISLGLQVEKAFTKTQPNVQLRKKRGGMVLSKQKLKNIAQAVNKITNETNEEEISDAPINSSFSSSEDQDNHPNQHFNNKEPASLKMFKMKSKKRRNGISTKILDSCKSFNTFDAEERPNRDSKSNLSKKNSVGSRTSFFRTSGFNLSEGKSNGTKSKFVKKQSKQYKLFRDNINQQIQIETEEEPNFAKLRLKKNCKALDSKMQEWMDCSGKVNISEVYGIMHDIHTENRLQNERYMNYYEQIMKKKYDNAIGQDIIFDQFSKPTTFKLQQLESTYINQKDSRNKAQAFSMGLEHNNDELVQISLNRQHNFVLSVDNF